MGNMPKTMGGILIALIVGRLKENRMEFKENQIVKYEDEKVRVLQYSPALVFIHIPSRQEQIWVKADKIEEIK